MKDIVIIGSGGFSKQVIEMIEEINGTEPRYNLIGLIDDNKDLIGNKIWGYEVIGDTDYLCQLSLVREIYAVIAIADGHARKSIAKKLTNIHWENLIHPSAIISKYVNFGVGNIICAGVIINPDFNLGNHCHINIGTTIGHDVTISNYVTIMPGSRISGNVILKSKATVGTGSVIIQGITIEDNVLLGAGAVVTRNTVSDSLYIGVPARKYKKIAVPSLLTGKSLVHFEQ